MEDIIKHFKSDLPKEYEIANNKSFPELLKKTDLLITVASSTCLEALACGVPVIIMKNNEGLTYDPIPKNISQSIYRKINDQNVQQGNCLCRNEGSPYVIL